MILRETVKKQIDSLNETQLLTIADFIVSLREQSQNAIKTVPFWQIATPSERSKDFLEWVSILSGTGSSLPDEAFDRATIYES